MKAPGGGHGAQGSRFESLSSWIDAAAGELLEAGVQSGRLEAQVLAAHALGMDRSWVLAHGGEAIDSSQADQLLARRRGREPLAYILGYREFYGRRFRVSSAVLIPRQETETLVAEALDRGPEGARVLDIGTGSGCIAITLKLEQPNWTVAASDVSVDALAVGRANAEDLGADVRFVESDLFGMFGGERFDLIVSNPPYVAMGEALMPEVAKFEPATALYAGDSGLAVYHRLATEASDFLADGGLMMMEVGAGQADSVVQIFADAGWRRVGTTADLAGVARVVTVGKAPQ